MEKLITEHLELWTSAQKKKASGGRGRGKKANGQSAYGIKKLRELILELAIRGKLVPQDPYDEPARVLLEKIAKEKARLVVEGKMKKQKPLPEIGEEEKPFELPKGWEWCRLSNVGETNIGLTYSPKDISDDGTPVLRSNNIQLGKLDLSNLVRVSTIVKEKVKANDGDLLICARNGSKALVGKCAIIKKLPEEFAFGAFMAIFRSPINKYLHNFIESPLFRKMIDDVNTTTINQITQGNLKSTVAPIPPLGEQHRIVAKVDELMALCDRLEQQQTDSQATHLTLVKTLLATLTQAADANALAESWQLIAEHFETLFITEESVDLLKQTILQLAVMGKLVPQDPNDEPARVLLQKIAKEKARLVAEGKMKKQKPLPEIGEEEKPFELPVGWEWVRLPDIGELNRGKSKHRPRNDVILYHNGNIPLVQTGDVARANGAISTYTALYNEIGLKQSRLWSKGTLCITIAANIADTGILSFDACFPDSVVGYIPFKGYSEVEYIDFFIRTAKDHLEQYAPSTAQKNINLAILNKLLIPLPPVAEQHRIVAKVNKLMALCDTLKSRLNDAQLTQLQLTDAIVEQAVS